MEINIKTNNNMKPFFQKLIKEAAKIDYNSIFIHEKQLQTNKASEEECQKIIRQLADSQGISEEIAFIALTTLFTKGICNKSAPPTMSTTVYNPDDEKEYVITKQEITSLCQLVCKHKFIRRIATALAEEICTCAEINHLEGDLSKRIDKILLAKGEPRLSPKEKAWANSFCQDLEGLEEFSSARLPKLLAEDYTMRFSKNNPKKNTKTAKNFNVNKNANVNKEIKNQEQKETPSKRQIKKK